VDQGPDALRTDIENTRQRLGDDVDALTEKVSPARVVHRRTTAARGRMTDLKDRVMGSSSDAAHSAGGSMGDTIGQMGDKASEAGHQVGDAVSSAPQMARQRTEGNPLAAGLIAFGVGWLASSLIPASQKEQDAAQRLTEVAKEHAGQVKAAAGQAANEMKEDLREPARQAAESVRSTATDAATTVQDEARDATGQVKGEAQDAAQEVKDVKSGSSSDDPTYGGTGTGTTPTGGTGAW
jgi:cell division septum initiation protein DivIVA